jgi:hypothetical protein
MCVIHARCFERGSGIRENIFCTEGILSGNELLNLEMSPRLSTLTFIGIAKCDINISLNGDSKCVLELPEAMLEDHWSQDH